MNLEEFIFFRFFPIQTNPPKSKKNRTQRYGIFFARKRVEKKKSLQNRQPSSQSVRNRLGNNICLHFRASNRPLDGVKGQKVVKKHVFLGSGPGFDPREK